MQKFDLVVIGGGINGTGVARDAAGRGLSVLLCEKDDLAQATSSSSTKLIHGGLRYLEFFHFKLVRESLREREILLKSMPHIIWPLRFTLPHHRGLRPSWLLRLGLFIYDHMGGRKLLPPTKKINLKKHKTGIPLKDKFSIGFEYSDCWVEDSRMVALNASDAKNNGAVIKTRTTFERATRNNDVWDIILDSQNGNKQKITSSAIVNCSGPWVTSVIESNLQQKNSTEIRLIKGSHIITKKLFDNDSNYIFQNSDGRIIFAIPYETDFTLIGTTDIEYEGDPNKAKCSLEEKKYLIESISEYLDVQVDINDIVHTYSGVRPLFNDNKSEAQNVTRDYVIKADSNNGKTPLISVFGGKITTYRILAEKVIDELKPYFKNIKNNWTKDSYLPGGNFDPNEVSKLVNSILDKYNFIDEKWAIRLVKAYGTNAIDILNESNTVEDLGINFGWNLTEKEVLWLINMEFAKSAEDILWRRSKLGLRFSDDQVKYLENWLKDNI
tara:strand:- start:1375 stop:2865 length:1491 start_codon:yes stop_codon:yes gene_type:complete